MSRRNFLAYVILTTCLVSGQLPQYVLKGQEVTLKKDITGRPDNILWTHDGNKVVEFNGRAERVYDPYKTRITLDWSSAELNIHDLRLEDSGKYELEVFVNQNLEKSYHEVEILDRVAKPTISCNINSNISGTLVCSAEPRQPVHLMTFEWHSQGSVHPGPHLQISLGDEHDDKVYSCVVRNPLTTETAAFTAKDCHTTKSSSVALIVAVIVISLLLLIGVSGILCYCRKKQKGSGGTVETDEATPFIGGRSGKVKEMVKKIELQNTVGAKHMTKQHQRPIPGNVEFKQASDQVSTDHENAEASSSSKPPPDATQNKDNINNKNTAVEDRLSQGLDTQEGHVSNKSESAAESADVGQNTSSEQKSFTAPASPGSDKIQHQHHDSSVQKDTDEYQLKEPVKEKQHDAGDSEPSDKSADRSKDMLSEPESSTASDGSADKAEIGAAEAEQLSESADKEKQQDQLNSAAVVSPGAVSKVVSKFESKVKTGQNKDDINNKSTTVEEDPDTQEGHAPNKSESAAESADVNQNPSTEQKSYTAPASPADKVDRDAAEAEELSESADKETQQDELNSPTVVSPGAVGDLLKFFEGKQNTGQTKDDINNKNTPAEDHLSEGSDKQEGHASNAESANVHQDTSSEQTFSTTPASPVLDPSKTDKSDSDPEQSSKVSLEKATDPAAAGPDTGSVSEPECAATGKKIPPSGINVQQLSEPADEEKQQGAGDPERSGESADSSEDVRFEVNCPADIARGLVKQRSKKFQKANLNKNKHQPSDGGTDQKDLDEQQLIEPSEKWKQEDVGDPESDDKSAERSENVSPEPKSPTAADGSGL